MICERPVAERRQVKARKEVPGNGIKHPRVPQGR